MKREGQEVRFLSRLVEVCELPGVAAQRVWAGSVVSPWFSRRTWALFSTVATLLGLTACRETVMVAPTQTDRDTGRRTYADAISNIAPSVVSVHTRTELTDAAASALTNDPAIRQLLERHGGNLPRSHPRALIGLGSGVVISRDGYVLTSGHVIEGADRIIVTTSEGEEFRARVIGTDEPTDIAVLKIEARNLPPARLADSNRLRVGDIVLAIGNPFGVGQTVTSGIVSGTKRDGFGIADYEDFIQTDASINPGNSGGALVDSQGRVVGISIAILSSGGGFEGIGLAVPINLARDVMKQLVTSGKVVRGYLGAKLNTVQLPMGRSAHVVPKKGARVSELVPGSPAARAGIRADDIILECNGKPVENDHELRIGLSKLAPGTRVSLKVSRGNQTAICRVTLGATPPTATKVEESDPQAFFQHEEQ